MSWTKATGSSKKKKKIDWDIFTREDLIKIAEWYKEITEKKKKKDKMNEAKSLDLWVFKFVVLLGISKLGYYKNKKVTYKSRRDPKLELIITKALRINKNIYGKKKLQNILNKTTISRFHTEL